MAHEYSSWAWSQEIAGPGLKFVLVALADSADSQGYSYPGQGRLAAMTGQSDRSVRRHLAWLEANGFVVREERRRDDGTRTSDAYRLPPRDPSTGQIGRWSTGQIGHMSTGQIGHMSTGQIGHMSTGQIVRLIRPEECPSEREEPVTASTGQIGRLSHQPAKLAGHEPKDLLLTSLSTHQPHQSVTESRSSEPKQKEEPDRDGASSLPRPAGPIAANYLQTYAKLVWTRLIDFRRCHHKAVPDAQFQVWANRVKDDVIAHGQETVIEALEVTIENFPQLDWPFTFYRTVVKRLVDADGVRPSAGPDAPRTGGSAMPAAARPPVWEDLIRQAKEGTL